MSFVEPRSSKRGLCLLDAGIPDPAFPVRNFDEPVEKRNNLEVTDFVSLGCALSFRRQHEAAVAAFERAVELNPNFTNWRFPFALILAGEPARAIDALKVHMSLDPFYEPQAPGLLGFACFMLKRYAEGLTHLRQCASRAPNLRLVRRWLAATYARLGDKTKAKADALEVLRLDPAYTIDGWARLFLPFMRAQDARHFFGGLQKAGIPAK